MLTNYSKLIPKSVLTTLSIGIIGLGISNAQSNKRLSVLPGLPPAKLEAVITQASDDNEEYVADGTTDFGSSDLEMVTEGGGQQIIGLRFASVKLPKNAVIQSAYIQFAADETHSNSVSLNFWGLAHDSLPTFANESKSISKFDTTTSRVDWANLQAWTAGEITDKQKSTDLKSIINEIISRPNWKSGNPIGFVVKGPNTGGRRVVDSYEDASAGKGASAKLVIEYYIPVTATFDILAGSDDNEEYLADGTTDFGSSDLEMVTEGGGQQLIGLRFGNVKLPKGVTINKANIQFAADETHSNSVSLNFWGIANDSLPTFVNESKSVSKYDTTTSRVDWINLQAWTAGEITDKQKTPDLTSIVNEIINRPNWKTGNPIGFVVKGPNTNGRRVADAFEDASAGKGAVAKLIVEYLGVPSQEKPKAKLGKFPMYVGQGEWEYNAEGLDLANNWKNRSGSDSAWAFGDAPIGFGSAVAKTKLPTGKQTYYARHAFVGDKVAAIDSLEFTVRANDGAVLYVNGNEVYRFNVGANAVNYNTLAIQRNPINARWERFTVKNTFVDGDTNTIAVELHQADINEDTLLFGLGVRPKDKKNAPEFLPIPKSSQWSYFDKGMEPQGNWKELAYNDAKWSVANGTFGYGDAHPTVIFNGENALDQYPTTYFRKSFVINDKSKLADTLLLNLRRDDGAIVYLNGVEIVRANMPAGNVDYTTFASSSVGGNDELTYFPYEILKSSILNTLVNGVNVIAVEIHQSDAASSDVSFDIEFKEKPKTFSFDPCATQHISCFTSVAPNTKNQLFNIPSSHAFQAIFTSGIQYTNKGNFKGDTLVPTNFDFTGFVPENMTSSTKGHLSINHETTFGAVSMLDIKFDNTSKLWSVDSSRAINFNEVAGTTRNCSGAVTPWGTIITAEETRNTGDANSDGYQDFGWLVEIDPKTNKIPQYGTGKEQKVWAAGRASHENAVVTADSSTLYWGEDNGSSNLYKYVLDKKADLSSGKLYSLKLNTGLVASEPTSASGTWVLVPNTTQSDRNNTYSLSAGLGATSFNGIEDVEISSFDGKIYFTAKGESRTYRFDDLGTNVANFETFVGGKSYTFATANGNVTEAWGTGNDNLTIDEKGNVWVLQDGSQDHIWVVRPNHTQANPKVELFATTPEGCEPTGMTFSPDHKFAFISLQNPSPTSTATTIDAAGNTIVFNKSVTLVMARKENLGGTLTAIDNETTVAQHQINIFPNPSEGNAKVAFTTKSNQKVAINAYTLEGKLVKNIASTSFAEGKHEVAVEGLASGIYLIQISIDNNDAFLKYIVK
ncbi:MAG: hypothetical protein RLZZ175_1866 [Bacteroidota bacterium]|jgi:secreted PhoX family phosphatase